jgi:signal transduction histidine kinase
MPFFRHHRVHVGLRLLLIAGAAFGMGVLWVRGQGGLALLIGLALLAGAAALVRYTEKPARDLTRFLESLRYDDASQRITSEGRGRTFDALADAFGKVGETFQTLRAEREEQARYLQTVVRHVGVALVAFRPDGEVTLVNHAARRLLGLSHLRRLDGLARVASDLPETLLALGSGERSLVRVERESGTLVLLAHAAQFRLLDAPYTLVSLQDIGAELEEQEMDAWQRLTRVLTHEIGNSVAPIASLAGTANGLLHAGNDALPPDDVADVREALATIERRSQGLMRFVEAYRSLTRIPKPSFALFPVRSLFDDAQTLLRTSFGAANVALSVEVEPAGLELVADRALVEQVLLNLLLNALQAIDEAGGRVTLRAHVGPNGRPVVEVEDDGPGIPEEALERVFVPFYTTKAAGSGIGLSLSRQVMRLHGGRLLVRSKPGRTVFTLQF